MRIIELFEGYSAGPVNKSPEEIIEILKKDCSQFVSAYSTTHKLIFRGIAEMRNRDDEVIEADIRQDRRPVFMPILSHEIINSAMQQVGLRAHRGNSIFCTTAPSIARDWGKVYAVFPVDGWAGTVFQKVKNGYVFEKLFRLSNQLEKDMMYSNLGEAKAIEKMKIAVSALKPKSFSSTSDVVSVITENYKDILITGSKYYAIAVGYNGNPESDITNSIFEGLGI